MEHNILKSYNMIFMYLINYLQMCDLTKSLFPKGKQLFICVEYGRHGHVFHVHIYLWMFYCNRNKISFSIKEAFTFYLDFTLSNLFGGIFSWHWLSHSSSNLGLSFQCLITKIAAFLSINSTPKVILSVANGSIYVHGAMSWVLLVHFPQWCMC